jgi:hypothetical protein
MSAEAIATIIAVVAGPILALWIQRMLDKMREAHKRKLDVFKALMTYRGTRLAPAFVQALNLIDLEFKDRRDKGILDAWKELQDHYVDWAGKHQQKKRLNQARLTNAPSNCCHNCS